MRTYTQEVHVGEYLGPVDWDFDFVGSGWDKGGSLNPGMISERVEMLKKISTGNWLATTDGGWPRFGWQKVLQVGMYDGWPHWKPVPSFLLSGVLGPEWHGWYMLTGIEEIKEKA